MYIGTNSARGYIEISDEARKANMAVFGIKSTGKSYTLIPSLLSQDLENKTKGITIFVDTPELAWYLYGLCKIKDPKRKVILLKPSRDFDILNNLFSLERWDYEEINKICDFEKAIRTKQVTIVDMEEERYGNKAVRAKAMLLLQLQSAMVVEYNKIPNHSVYIDSATNLLPYIKNLLKYGDFYGFDSILFFKSREELGDDAIIVDNYVRNYILLQGINYEDAKYFGERLNTLKSTNDSVQGLLNRQYGTISYEILSGNGFQRETGEGMLVEFSNGEKKAFREKAKQLKKRSKEISVKDQHYQLEEEAEALSEEKSSYLDDVEEKDLIHREKIKTISEITDFQKEEPKKVNIPCYDSEPKEWKNVDIQLERDNQANIEKDFTSEIEEPIIENTQKVEPQLNKKIKTSGYQEAKEKLDFSLLDEIPEEELPEIKVEENIPFEDNFFIPDEPEKLDLPKEETFDLLDNKKFVIGSKNVPYKKIKNKRIDKALAGFKI